MSTTCIRAKGEGEDGRMSENESIFFALVFSARVARDLILDTIFHVENGHKRIRCKA